MQLAKRLTIVIICAGFLTFTANGCKTIKNASNTAKGGVIGAAGGALAGAVIGKAAGNTVVGAIIGAAVGGAAGAAIGHYMDKQAKELDSKLEDAKVERVGEGIKITLDSGILFDFDSADLRAASKANIEKLADVLKEYENTKILLAGYTDSKGSDAYNQKLSLRRAKSVALYMAKQDVDATRMIIKGYGESNPVATNSTEAGRQQNRRVEIALYANKKLKKMAKEGKIG